MKVHFEMTDTFGGESNYSWVKRHSEDMPDGVSNLALVRRLKKWASWQGERCEVTHLGEMISIRPHSACLIAFITFN